MSTLFKGGPTHTKEIHHPWQKYIKDVHSNNFKTAHNTVNNPQYPKKKQKIPNKRNLIKFTIIGDRFNKEFIHSVYLVKDLHKYRWKIFDAPIIRGVTTVEWPKVWNELKLQHGGIAFGLQSPLAVLINDKFLGGNKELRELLASRFDYHLSLDYYKEGVGNFVNFVRSSGRPCAYMHISIHSEHVGTLIFMLYADLVPYTCENFLRLCETKRGGYSGTPVHRIVKDGWIQCGGFGLKSTDLDCENFIVPHDRRGVLCMANNGRHVDCSTQFFVLLQSAPWMAHKYVAFGQLIDGDSTLKAIESVQTFYESPTISVQIEKAGVLNLECHGIRVSKTTNEYIQGHIEDLIALGDLLGEELMEKVFLEIELKHVMQLEMEKGEAEQSESVIGEESRIHATKRFIRKKEDLEKLQKSQTYTSRASSAVSQEQQVNNDFDVDEYEPEEYSYQQVSLTRTVSVVVKPEKPFYIPLTDVTYPGEKDSTYDLKKFLRGDYCLESDLVSTKHKKEIRKNLSFTDIYKLDDESDNISLESLSSDDEQEIRRYLKLNIDRVSFAGSVVRNIARNMAKRKCELITDEELRRFRIASKNHQCRENNKVRIAESAKTPSQIRTSQKQIQRRVTGSVQPSHLSDSDIQVRRQSALSRLYDNMTEYDNDEEGPTLRGYKSPSIKQKNFILTQSPMRGIKHFSRDSGNFSQDNHLRPLHSVTIEGSSIEQVLNVQHSRKFARKISSDYVKTIDQIEHRLESSIRSVEFAKTRPSMTVSEYQLKNLKHQESMKKANHDIDGLRLPGDTPLYSMTDI
ncbi:uncharacterized protein LOC123872878 isoform X2 [Maniola jurtina]|uniref:uncharacterized protein LOC123872878 isoform X2 n=1 Tax=Maniola jurtina TaxID=191418 RepID=UPI001E685FF5|nr:uncharacterized protein LOC123872878 isoform X2 [Maniola jurtina]